MTADQPLRILFVEDSPLDMELAERALRKEGLSFTSKRVETQDDFFVALEKYLPDLIISDYALPQFDGVRALQLSLEHDPLLPFILITGSLNEETAVACIKAGATDYILKDRIARLPFAVREALEQHKTRLAQEAAEWALRESENKYHKLFSEMLNGCALHEMIYDSHGNAVDYVTLEVNAAYESILNARAEDVVGKKASEILPKDELRQWLEFFGPVASTGKSVRYESYSSLNKKHFEGSAYSPEKGKFAVTFSDITERKKAETGLRTSEAQLSNAMKIAHLGYWEYDVAADLFTFNDHFYSIFHTTAEKEGGYTMSPARYAQRFVHPGDTAVVGFEIQKAIESDDPHYSRLLEHRILYADGGVGHIAVRFFIVKDEGGKTIKTFGANQDITERKQAEDTLRESEARFSTIFHAAPVSILITRLSDGEFIDANEAFQTISGCSREEIIGHTSLGLNFWVNPEDRGQMVAELRQRGRIQDFETRFRKKSGEICDVLLSAELIDLAGNQYMLNLAQDITERKRTEAMVRERERQMHALVTSLDDSVFELDEQGVILNVWVAFESLLSRPRAEVIGRPVAEILGEEFAYPFLESLQRVITSGQAENIEYPLEVVSGQRWFLARISPIRSIDGSYKTVSVLIRDITERKQADDALRMRKEELTLLLEAGRELSSTLDLKEIYAILYRNIARSVPCDALVVSTFDPVTELIRCQYLYENHGEVDVSAFPPIPLEPEGQGTQSLVIRSGKSLLLPDYEAQRKSASTKYYTDEHGHVLDEIPEDVERTRSAILVPIMVEGRVTGVVQIFSYQLRAHTLDHLHFVEALIFRVTAAMSNAALFQRVQSELAERSRAEEQVRKLNVELEQRVSERTADLSRANAGLEKAARAKDEFLASMSHELRTPLNAILTLAESLDEGIYGPLNELQVKPLHTIAESGYHLLNLINDILDLSKIEAGKLQLRIEPVEVESLCQASLRLVRQQAQKKDLDVSLDVDQAVKFLRADARYLKQMLVNLLSNAVKFTPEGGQVGLVVRGNAAQGVAHFTVWDTGIGIAKEDAHRLFQPFSQVDSSLARQYGGSGLGLSLVYRMAEMHGGGVSLDSATGQGSRFTISLPWAGPAEPRGTGPLKASFMPRVEQALIIEASSIAADQLVRYLDDLGARVAISPAGESALEKAVEVRPDLIILDIPRLDTPGRDMLAQLKADARTRAIPVIIISEVDEPVRELALEAADYIVKPLTRQRLREAIWKAFTPALAAADEPVVSAMGRQPVLLIAEDNPDNQIIYAEYLSANGYRVILAANGAQAVNRAREERPDLILMDIQMPGMDGLEATRRLRADPDSRSIPIITLTALAMPGDREQCLAAGADDYLTKPVSLKQLVLIIETHLEGKRK